MSTLIYGLGLATPPHQMTQEEATQMFTDIVCQENRQTRLARVLFRKSEVETRSTVVPHKIAYQWCQVATETETPQAPMDITTVNQCSPIVAPGQSHGPTTAERMQLYARFASELAVTSSRQALEHAQIDPATITHLVLVTCTGFDSPGIDIELIQKLGLPHSAQRIQVGFMGCHGAINGIRTALAIAKADPAARVLLCAVELCSLHYRFTWDAEGIIGNALFADGSGALVIGSQEAGHEKNGINHTRLPVWRIHNTGSVLIRDSKAAMSWTIGNHGFEMRLTSDVGDKIEDQLAAWLTQWLADQNLQLDDVKFWGVHPGGPRILSAVQKSLGLSDEALQTSRTILRRHGNMSSPTVLFILNEFQQARLNQSTTSNGGYCVLLGFGPGLFAEVALLSTGSS